VAKRFQGVVRAEHAAAAGAEDIPAEIEQPEARRMQEGRNDLLLVEPVPRGKIQQVDAVEVAILALCDQLRNGLDDRGIGGLPQNGELGLGIAHGDNLDEAANAAPQDALSFPKRFLRRTSLHNLRKLCERHSSRINPPKSTTGA